MASDTQLILHSVKGSYLECDEIDANFTSLKTTADASKDIADANKVKLDTVEDNSTADQTDSEIKTAYENNSDTNALTDALKSKLDSVEASATTDQTGAEIKTAYENNADTNALTDTLKTKVESIGVMTNLTTATRPVNPTLYTQIWDTDLSKSIICTDNTDTANIWKDMMGTTV